MFFPIQRNLRGKISKHNITLKEVFFFFFLFVFGYFVVIEKRSFFFPKQNKLNYYQCQAKKIFPAGKKVVGRKKCRNK